VSPAQARQYLGKAEEYLEVAQESLAAGRFIAATGNAVHAAINAADAVCGSRTGTRSAGQDHDDVLKLLRQAGHEGEALAKHLARLLPLKVRAEYEPDDVPRSDASAVRAAERAVAVARRVLAPLTSERRADTAAPIAIGAAWLCRYVISHESTWPAYVPPGPHAL
jgi:HEPN domain-containing protein